MTRKEEIMQQASLTVFPWDDVREQSKFEDGFIEGAKWADKHPNPNTIKTIFKFALEKTNFLIADNLESIDWEVLIKKAMK